MVIVFLLMYRTVHFKLEIIKSIWSVPGRAKLIKQVVFYAAFSM